ncbi:MAG: GIY-YIG nuclease family protein [Akkermansiaceae bacterium]|nr:GIY-YIG nuclease family protein [Akkermansiaceae bacterium]
MYYVYVLQSGNDHGLYIGYTSDLRRRRNEHEQGLSKSTKGRRPLDLIYYEAYLDQSDALGRERFLKSGAGRMFLKKQLKHHFETFPVPPRDA